MAVVTTSKRDLLYQDESARIYWDSDVQCIEFEAIRYVSATALRATLQRTLDLIRQRKARKFLIGLVKVDNIPMEELLWAETNWFPLCLRSGIKYVSMVMPKALSALVAVDKSSSRVNPDASGFARRFFSDVEEGRRWLKEQK